MKKSSFKVGIDLDDTLLIERTFLYNVYDAIASYVSVLTGDSKNEVLTFLLMTHEFEGRYKILDKLYDKYAVNIVPKTEFILRCLNSYKSDESFSSLKWNNNLIKAISNKYSFNNWVILTNGRQEIQLKKIEKLELQINHKLEHIICEHIKKPDLNIFSNTKYTIEDFELIIGDSYTDYTLAQNMGIPFLYSTEFL